MKTDKVIDGVLIKATKPKAGKPYVWPKGVTEIGGYAFSDWKSFNQPFSIPKDVTKIGEWAFSNWESFDQPFSIPKGVTEIGESFLKLGVFRPAVLHPSKCNRNWR